MLGVVTAKGAPSIGLAEHERWCAVQHQLQTTVLRLYGVFGEEARRKVVAALRRVRGVREVRVNLFRSEAGVLHEAGCGQRALVRAIALCGHFGEVWGSDKSSRGRANEHKTGGKPCRPRRTT